MTKITVLNTQVWARNIGGYAAVTDISHREVLEKTLKLSKEVPASLAPWKQWLAVNDIAGVILQPGIKRVSARAQDAIRMMKATLTQADEQTKAVMGGLDLYVKLFQAAEKEISTYGFGLQLDKQNALRLTTRSSLVPNGRWAQFIAQMHSASENLLAGLPDEPFVMAGGLAFSDAMLDKAMKFTFLSYFFWRIHDL